MKENEVEHIVDWVVGPQAETYHVRIVLIKVDKASNHNSQEFFIKTRKSSCLGLVAGVSDVNYPEALYVVAKANA